MKLHIKRPSVCLTCIHIAVCLLFGTASLASCSSGTVPEDTTAPAEDPTTEQDTTEDVTEQPGGCKSAVAGAAGTALLACALIGTAGVGKKNED